ncbi:MAG: hypothetical protein AAGH89_11290 [Verrucomicrobiota bacterium]
METNAHEADRELLLRYERAAKQLEPWKLTIDAIDDHYQREQANGRFSKIEKLATYVSERLSELDFARDNGLDYLCRDAAKKVDEFEREILKLRNDYNMTATAPTETAPTNNASRPSAIQDMRAASSVSASLAPPSSPTAPGRSSVIQDMKAKAATGSVQISTSQFAEVANDVQRWAASLDEYAQQIRSLEKSETVGSSPTDRRRRIVDLQSKHRKAMERIGRCRGWVRTGVTRLASTKDWHRDFDAAREEVTNLGTLVEGLVKSASAATPPPSPSLKPEVKTVPIGRAKNTKTRPSIGLAPTDYESN